MENYKEKYTKALERTRTFILRWQGIGAVSSELALKELKEIFSELKDNKDEAIKNDIIITLSNDVMCDDSALYPGANTTLKEAVVWLKKQGEHANFRNKIQVGDRVTRNEDGVLVNLSQLDRVAEPAEKQRKKYADKCIGCNNFKGCITCTDGDQYAHITEQKPTDNLEPKFKVGDKIKLAEEPKYPAREIIAIKNDAYCFDKLEQLPFINQDKWELVEQTPADKVEPKFKVGDFIINEYGFIMQIDGIDGNMYVYHVLDDNRILKHDITKTDKSCHLWTIQDAKDGDVLYHKSPLTGIDYIVMSRGVNGYGNVDSYFRYNSVDGFAINVPSVFDTKKGDITPATKEQRDFLFKKMKEAGYEWDAEKKESKQIEQEDDTELTDFESALFSAFSDAWQEYLSGEEVDVEKWTRDHSAELLEVAREQNTAWSEEDDYILNLVSKFTSKGYKSHPKIPSLEFVQDWLKSLKERVQPQPKQDWSENDERMCKNLLFLMEQENSISSWEGCYEWLESLKERMKGE